MLQFSCQSDNSIDFDIILPLNAFKISKDFFIIYGFRKKKTSSESLDTETEKKSLSIDISTVCLVLIKKNKQFQGVLEEIANIIIH